MTTTIEYEGDASIERRELAPGEMAGVSWPE